MNIIFAILFFTIIIFVWNIFDKKLNGLLSDSFGYWKYLIFLVAYAIYPVTIVLLIFVAIIGLKNAAEKIEPLLIKLVKSKSK